MDKFLNSMKNKKIPFSELESHFNKTTKRGVYFIFDENEELIYIGESGAKIRLEDSTWGLQDRLKQHFSKKDTGRQDFNVPVQTVKDEYFLSYIEVADEQDISNLEVHFINFYKPKFNNQHK